MLINKSSVVVDGRELHVSMPFAKVNEKKRTVSGWATLDNEDTQGDVVTAEASLDAFTKARGNLREMHKKDSAIGRIVSFKEAELLGEDNEIYKGIFVTARVSEGAPDAWHKVLDGTYSGFSIGGNVKKVSNDMNKAGTKINKVLEYELTELSLVDNPANPMANITEFHKIFDISKFADTGETVVTGEVADTLIENVFICKADDNVLVSEEDSVDCPLCETGMENAGWFESTTDTRAEKARGIVSEFKKNSEAETPAQNGGVQEMGDNNNNEENENASKPDEAPQSPETTVVEQPEAAATVDETEGAESGAPEAESVEETSDEVEEFSKKIDELKVAMQESFEKNAKVTGEKVEALEKRVTTFQEEMTQRSSELEKSLSDLVEKHDLTKSRLEEAETRLNKINASDALRKSADIDEVSPVINKNNNKTARWGHAFSGNHLFQ